MSIKIIINENDNEDMGLKKYSTVVREYGKAIYDKCMSDRHISAGVKKYITPSVCNQFATKLLSKVMVASFPTGQEVEIELNPGHVVRVIQYAENQYKKNQSTKMQGEENQSRSPKSCQGRQSNQNINDDDFVR